MPQSKDIHYASEVHIQSRCQQV